jgi:hypothetical protein
MSNNDFCECPAMTKLDKIIHKYFGETENMHKKSTIIYVRHKDKAT